MHGVSVRDYDKRFKDLPSQIPYQLEERLLVQWFVASLLHIIREPLRMHEIINYDNALEKF